jgi:hypothetical protein
MSKLWELPEQSNSQNHKDFTLNPKLVELTWWIPEELEVILWSNKDYADLTPENIKKLINRKPQIVAINIAKFWNISWENILTLVKKWYFSTIKSFLEKHNILWQLSSDIAKILIEKWDLKTLVIHLRDLSWLSFQVAQILMYNKERDSVVEQIKSFSRQAQIQIFTFFLNEWKLVYASKIESKIWKASIPAELYRKFQNLTNHKNRIPKKTN